MELGITNREKALGKTSAIFENCLFPEMNLEKSSEISHSRKFVHAKLLKFLVREN